MGGCSRFLERVDCPLKGGSGEGRMKRRASSGR